MENKLRGIIISSFLSTDEKNELLDYLEELLEKAWKYDELD